MEIITGENILKEYSQKKENYLENIIMEITTSENILMIANRQKKRF